MGDSKVPEPCKGSVCNSPRRELIKCCAGAVIGLVVGAHHDAHAEEAVSEQRPQTGDELSSANMEAGAPSPLTVDSLAVGGKPLIAFPLDPGSGTVRNGSRLNRVLLLKLAPEQLDDATRPLSADGVVAYSAVCTHQGCDLSEYNASEGVFFCFCHFSKFRPGRHGEVASGPAPRRLPILPLRSEGGRLVVAAPFSSRPGATT